MKKKNYRVAINNWSHNVKLVTISVKYVNRGKKNNKTNCSRSITPTKDDYKYYNRLFDTFFA